MSIETLSSNISKHILSVELCLEHNLRMPALILIYSGIDILATLARPEEKDIGSRADFKRWCDKYLLPESELNCTATDLYAARCGILHSYTAESQLSKKLEANELVYAWGSSRPESLQEIIDCCGLSEKVIHIEQLFLAFKSSIVRFLEDLHDSNFPIEVIEKRARKFFMDRPS